MSAFFVTATGTDIGKTYVTAGLVEHWRRRGGCISAIKPIISGVDDICVWDSDLGVLLDALGRPSTMEEAKAISPWRFAAPLSPDIAARLEKRTINFDKVVQFCRNAIDGHKGTLLIEGIGGIMVPIGRHHTVLDWMIALQLPLILVAGTYLGSISHTLTTLDVLRRNKLKIVTLVISERYDSDVSLEETAKAIGRFAPWINIFRLPHHTAETDSEPDFTKLAALLEREMGRLTAKRRRL